jgi:hypothetical protein
MLPLNHPRYFLAGVKRRKPVVPGMGPPIGEIKQAAASMSKMAIHHFVNMQDTPARAFSVMTPPVSRYTLASLGEMLKRIGA